LKSIGTKLVAGDIEEAASEAAQEVISAAHGQMVKYTHDELKNANMYLCKSHSCCWMPFYLCTSHGCTLTAVFLAADLIDEYTGMPVIPEERSDAYPIVITTPSETAVKFLPLMQSGLKVNLTVHDQY
jgi:hypothetical protein